MKINQIIINEDKQRLDPSCWTGYHKAGTKMKGGTRVNNCVPNESINEFAPPEGDDGPNEDEILFKLAQKWWLGSEQDMIRAERALASMGWEIGEDEGSYDNGGVFVVRAGDEHGKSYQSWPHEDLIDEGQTSDMRSFFSTQQPLNPAPIQSPATGPVIATVTRPSESVKESMPASVIKNKQRNASMSDKEFYQAHKDKSEDELKGMAHRHGYGKGSTHYVDKCKKGQQELEEGENWSKHNNPRAGGMSQKSVKSYRRSHPGSKIQTAVTTKPSKLKKGSKSAKRRASFCARMRGMKKHRTGAKTARDPNSNINKSLRRWHCESVEDMQQLVMLAEQKVNEAKNLAQQAATAIDMKKKHKKPKHVNESDNIEQSKYLQGAKDIIKGADPHHIARVRNLDPDTLQRYVRVVWDKLDSKEYNYRKPDLAEVKDDEDDGLIGGRYTPEQWAKMINNLKRKAQEQDAKKKQDEKSKDLGESTTELNNILTLSGNNK